MAQILVIDDEQDISRNIKDTLRRDAHMVVCAENGSEGLLKLKNQKFDLVITDLKMPGTDGEAVIREIRESKQTMPIVVTSGWIHEYDSSVVLTANVTVLDKPFSTEEIRNVVNSLLGGDEAREKTWGTRFALAEGDILIKEGEANRTMYWLKQGQLEVFRMTGKDEIHLGRIYEGEIVGEVSFLDNRPRSASVRAERPSELVEIPYKKFVKSMSEQPMWFKLLVRSLCDRLRKADKKIV